MCDIWPVSLMFPNILGHDIAQNNPDILDAGIPQVLETIENVGLVGDGDELFGACMGQGVKMGSLAAGKDEAFQDYTETWNRREALLKVWVRKRILFFTSMGALQGSVEPNPPSHSRKPHGRRPSCSNRECHSCGFRGGAQSIFREEATEFPQLPRNQTRGEGIDCHILPRISVGCP